MRASNEVGKVAIYKKTYNEKRDRIHIPVEERAYNIHILVPNTKGGIRKLLSTPKRVDAIK